MSLADKIAALPEWPKQPDISDPETAVDNAIAFAAALLDCHATRLALAREWITSPRHLPGCETRHIAAVLCAECDGKILAALEPPK